MAKSTPTTFDPAEEPKAPKAAKTAAAQTAAPKTESVPATPASAVHTTYPGQTLGIVALVLAFFLPLPALALGIIAWVWSHKAGKNNVLAKISVGISGAFAVIGVFLFGLWIAFASAFAGGLYGGPLPGDRVVSGSVHVMPGQGGMIMPGEFGDMDDMMHEFDEEMGNGHMKNVPATPVTPAPTDEAVTN